MTTTMLAACSSLPCPARSLRQVDWMGLSGVLGGYRCCSAAAKKSRRQDNFWGIDLQEEQEPSTRTTRKRQQGRDIKERQDTSFRDSIVTAMLLVAQEEILQPEEIAPVPLWKTFAGNVSGVWKGVGAVFSPDTGEIQPIGLGRKNEYLYDCRVVGFVGISATGDAIERETLWNLENMQGEKGKEQIRVQDEDLEKDILDEQLEVEALPEEEGVGNQVDDMGEQLKDPEKHSVSSKYFYPDMKEMMEKDQINLEPSLVFFPDGAYSRGPLNLLRPKDDVQIAAGYFYTPLFKIEQCLVRDGHKRARIVHTVSVDLDSEEVQVVRLALYEEEWIRPVQVDTLDERAKPDLPLLSQRKRTSPRELAGTWNVFEQSALFEDNEFVYTCREIRRRKKLPAAHNGDEEADAVWLPGGYFSYVHIDEAGMLRIGAGWHCKSSNLTMERCYDSQGQLVEVKSQCESK